MKKWLKVLGAVLVVVGVMYGYGQWSKHRLAASVDKVRRELRQQGFKADLSDFNFDFPAEIKARANTIVSAGQAVRSLRQVRGFVFREVVGTNVALAISPIQTLETYSVTNLWPVLKEELGEQDRALDAACAALLAGPVKFQPTARPGGEFLLPYLAGQRDLAQVLAVRAVLAMHEHNTNGVFTNLLALSRMATGWTPEPMEVCHLVRFGIQGIAEQAIWEAMQTDGPTDAQLAALQREWESVRFFEGLPETAELSCASMVRMCQAIREESYLENPGGWGETFRYFGGALISSPWRSFQILWLSIREYFRQANYRSNGSYEDEKALMFFYRDRHQELKRAIACSTWSEMRTLPGATNVAVFHGVRRSRIDILMRTKQIGLRWQRGPRTLLARAAEAEATRRLIVTALALERFALQHKTYPQSLTELVPAFLPAVPVDFMDGKELRYRRQADGRYLLYSVGLDGVDHGGTLAPPRSRRGRVAGGLFSPTAGADVVWPLPARQAEVDAYEKAQAEDEKRMSVERPEFPEQ